MVDVDVAAHAVGHQDLMHRVEGDAIQALQQRLAPRTALQGAIPQVAGGSERQQRRTRRDPLRF